MRRILSTAAMIAALASPLGAQGQNCASREMVLERLAEKYGETRQSIGLASKDSVVEVFASLKTGTWTITVTNPNGITCLIAAGSEFQVTNMVLPKEGDPT